MKLALITGKQNGNIIKERLQGIKDNLDINVFDDIPEYIDFAKKRNLIFDRLVIVSNLITPASLKDLHTWWNFTSKDTNIIVIGKKSRDDKMAEAFNTRFQSPVTAFMLVESSSVKLFAEAVLAKAPDLNDKYGIAKNNVEIMDEGVTLNLPTNEPEKKEEVQPEQKKEPVQQKQPQNDKKEKKGLFGGLFGKKEKTPNKKNEPTTQINMADAMQSLIDEGMNNMNQNQAQTMQNQQQQMQNQQQMTNNPTVQNSPISENREINSQMPNNNDAQNFNPNFSDFGNTSILVQPTTGEQMLRNPEEEPKQSVEEFASNNEHITPEQNNVQIMPDINQLDSFDFGQPEQTQQTQDVQDTGFDFSNPVEQPQPQFEQQPIQQQVEQPQPIQPQPQFVQPQSQPQVQQPQQVQRPQPQPVQTQPEAEDVNMSFDMGIESFDYSGLEEFGVSQNNVQSTSVDDIDLGADTVQYNPNSKNLPIKQPTIESKEVGTDFGDMSAASAEQAYRQQQEAPKVIVKEVIKEVKVNTGHGTINSLKGVLAGKSHKVLIVTGDRATGITTTALSIAQELAKQVPILYFDCDVNNHGLLSYINYDNFRDYENVHMQGVKLAKNAKAFNTCACRYADNFDILTTDYSCDVTDEELETASMTVAEVAGNYGVVVVDCPVEKIHLLQDLVMIGNTVLCVEGSKRGFMNMLAQLESSSLATRYKRAMVSKGTMFITKVSKNANMKQLKAYISDIFVPTGADWMSMQATLFNGKVNDSLLNTILE